jgi:hypothetical protein
MNGVVSPHNILDTKLISLMVQILLPIAPREYSDKNYIILGLMESDPFDFQSGINPMSFSPKIDPATNLPDFYTIIIVSRRSRHRAGGNLIKFIFVITDVWQNKLECLCPSIFFILSNILE